MLTPDLLPVRRKNGELCLTPLVGKVRKQHLELAEQVVEIARSAVGLTREQFQTELSTVGQTPAESRIVRGLAKLAEDATTFEQDRGRGAADRREVLFERAATAWLALGSAEQFDRVGVLEQVATGFSTPVGEFEAELFVDLPAAQRVLEVIAWTAEELVERYEQARIAAVLLRAVSVRVTFRIGSALDVRQLFRKLKFRQLMFELERMDDGRHRLTLTGPYSLFESVTKYGLQLALCWPELSLLEGVSLEADLRWGKRGEKLKFSLEGSVGRSAAGRRASSAAAPAGSNADALVRAEPARAPIAPAQTDDVRELRESLSALDPTAVYSDGNVVLELPGVGLCVPDLCRRTADGTVVHLEVMGYWSRSSVWQRVELVDAGLIEPVLFLVSSRLRISEELLDEQSASALYVYRGRISPSKVLSKINALAERRRSRPRSAPLSK